MKKLLLLLLLAGCVQPYTIGPPQHLQLAYTFLGYSETANARELRAFTGVNPRHVEWCAAFVNNVLENSGLQSVETLSIGPPLMARSYLRYGDMLLEDEVMPGDILVFSRGRGWQGHVGFYVGEEEINGRIYYRVLGGNQDNEVNISLYPKSRLLGIRRPTSDYSV